MGLTRRNFLLGVSAAAIAAQIPAPDLSALPATAAEFVPQYIPPVGSIYTFVDPSRMYVFRMMSDIGWIDCNGDLLSRELFPELFDVIGRAYGRWNGDDEFFNLPDLRPTDPEEVLRNALAHD